MREKVSVLVGRHFSTIAVGVGLLTTLLLSRGGIQRPASTIRGTEAPRDPFSRVIPLSEEAQDAAREGLSLPADTDLFMLGSSESEASALITNRNLLGVDNQLLLFPIGAEGEGEPIGYLVQYSFGGWTGYINAQEYKLWFENPDVDPSRLVFFQNYETHGVLYYAGNDGRDPRFVLLGADSEGNVTVSGKTRTGDNGETQVFVITTLFEPGDPSKNAATNMGIGYNELLDLEAGKFYWLLLPEDKPAGALLAPEAVEGALSAWIGIPVAEVGIYDNN